MGLLGEPQPSNHVRVLAFAFSSKSNFASSADGKVNIHGHCCRPAETPF